MAPGLTGRFPGFSLVAVSALGFVGFLTFIGFVYEKLNKIGYKDKQNVKKSQTKTGLKESHLDSTSQTTPQGELTTPQIEHLIDVIETVDEATLENLLISLANCCAFTRNQTIIRERGGLPKLIQLLHHDKVAVRSRASQTLSNLAMNLENQKHISVCIPVFQQVLNPEQISNRTEDEVVAVFQLLVNLSVVDTWHADMTPYISYCFDIMHMDSLSIKVKMNTLRLLVNLSCNPENVEHFLNDQILILARFMDPTTDEDIILRTVVVILNVLQNIGNHSLKEIAKELSQGVEGKLDILETSENEEIATKVTKIKMLLNNL